MKNFTKKVLLGGALMLAAAPSFAQFTLDGELRPRFEYRNGYKSVADSNQTGAAFVQQRTRLNFGYKTEGYIFKLTLQDVRVWGSQPQLVGTYSKVNTSGSYFGVHEAWGEALLSKAWSLKFGRQEIILDNHRIFGSVGWAQQARSHDAAILKYKKDKLKFQLAAAYNQDKAGLTNRDAQFGSYKAFQYLWAHYDVSKDFGASVLFLNNGKEQLDSSRFSGQAVTAYYKDNYSQTYGTRLTYKKNKLSVAGSFYFTGGMDANRNVEYKDDKKIAAMNYSIDVSYKITDKFTAAVGYEYLSGQSQTDTTASYLETNHAFNPFYGTNHKFNGYMDYFYVGNHGGSVGLNDIYLKGKFKSDKFWVGADVHLFSAANDVWDGFKYNTDLTEATTNGTAADVTAVQDKKYTGYTMDANFGTEIDVTFGFKLSKGVDFKAGYSMMLATETLAYVKGTTDYQGQGYTDATSSWGWAMITIKPQFISAKKKEEKKEITNK